MTTLKFKFEQPIINPRFLKFSSCNEFSSFVKMSDTNTNMNNYIFDKFI